MHPTANRNLNAMYERNCGLIPKTQKKLGVVVGVGVNFISIYFTESVVKWPTSTLETSISPWTFLPAAILTSFHLPSLHPKLIHPPHSMHKFWDCKLVQVKMALRRIWQSNFSHPLPGQSVLSPNNLERKKTFASHGVTVRGAERERKIWKFTAETTPEPILTPRVWTKLPVFTHDRWSANNFRSSWPHAQRHMDGYHGGHEDVCFSGPGVTKRPLECVCYPWSCFRLV